MACAIPPCAPPFDNTSIWQNFTAWTAQQLRYTVNMTKYAPSLEDLVLAGPRMVMKLGSFISIHDAIEGFGSRGTSDAAGPDIFQATTAGSLAFAPDTTTAASHLIGADQGPNAFVSRFSMEGAKGLGSVFSYATSKWALCCIAMAVILNRTYIFAATRRRLQLRWPVRLLLRFIPIILLAAQARKLLQSIQCQTSPDFSQLRWGDANKSSDFMFTQPGGPLHSLSMALLFGAEDVESCRAVHMIPLPGDTDVSGLQGSLSRLWPLFGTICLSAFLETISCAVHGRPVAAETGMNLFEHSLAFAEADAAISNQLGWGMFGNSHTASSSTGTVAAGNIAISRAMILNRVNTPPEVLLVAFLSAMSHLTSHLLGVFNVQSRFRLVNTGFWSLCFMGSILWSAITFSFDDPLSQGLLRFPIICIIGFIPHVLVLAGILVCFGIYGLALMLCALSPPDNGDGRQLSFAERLAHAHGNMQANISLSDIRITMEMDFYTALLRTGFGAITMASEAVYLSEDHQVNLKRNTWLEDERFREIEELRMQWLGAGLPGSRHDSSGTIGLVPVKDSHLGATSGFSRERAAQKISKTRIGDRRVRQGIGAAERSERWLMAIEFGMKIYNLAHKACAMIANRIHGALVVRVPERWLRWLVRQPKTSRKDETRDRGQDERPHGDERFTDATSQFNIPNDDEVDVEAEMRRGLAQGQERIGPVDETDLDNKLYAWWLKGGWWGSTDDSGDFQPIQSEDDDTTSVISASIAEHDSGWESDDAGQDGLRTPTQRSPDFERGGSPIIDNPLPINDLARLLHPSSPEEREEARVFSAHFSSDSPMTRSRYQNFRQRQKAKVLLSSRSAAVNINASAVRGRLTPDEEAVLLEQLLLSRRTAGRASVPTDAPLSWSAGASGLGPEGPQCVVCQSSPRTIIVWPCRCLSLCDDCRVALAMNNFDKCVCCRREVISFSRIYVP